MSQESDLRVKHLEMLEDAVTRMANYGATLKNYCVTLSVAILGFAISHSGILLALSSIVPVISFCLLDAQYLRIERQFRRSFDTVRTGDWSLKPDFDMSPNETRKESYLSVILSWSITGFYGPLSVLVLAFTLIYYHIK